MKKQNDRVIRKPEVRGRIALSDATIYRMEKAGRFPQRIQLGGNSVGWFESEVDAWLKRKSCERQGCECTECQE